MHRNSATVSSSYPDRQALSYSTTAANGNIRSGSFPRPESTDNRTSSLQADAKSDGSATWNSAKELLLGICRLSGNGSGANYDEGDTSSQCLPKSPLEMARLPNSALYGSEQCCVGVETSSKTFEQYWKEVEQSLKPLNGKCEREDSEDWTRNSVDKPLLKIDASLVKRLVGGTTVAIHSATSLSCLIRRQETFIWCCV